jgi:hypothetical protein
MKRTIITLSAAVALTAVVFTLGGLNMTRAQGQQGGQGNQGNQGNQSSVVGTWIVTVYVNTPGGPAPFATEFASFNPGGTFADAITLAFSAENPGFAGPLAPFAVNFSDAFGSWKQVGDDPSQIAGTFKRFSFAGANTPTEITVRFSQDRMLVKPRFSSQRLSKVPPAAKSLRGPSLFNSPIWKEQWCCRGADRSPPHV